MNKNKYKDTLFENNFPIPSKKENSKDYFFKFPLQQIGYISFSNLLILIVYYGISFLFFSLLYDKHFVFSLILLGINVFLGIILMLRENNTGKSGMDIIFIVFRYMKKKNIGIFKGKKNDLFSKNQL